MGSLPTLQDKLQAEFCPPLDTSLLAALVTEVETQAKAENRSVSSQEVFDLRKTLTELSNQAEEDENLLSEKFAGATLSTDDSSTVADERNSSPGTSATSGSSSIRSFSSPLGFLQAAFPHLSTQKLKRALGDVQNEEEIDMEAIMDCLLTDEYLREVEERGLDGLDGAAEPPSPWRKVEVRKRQPTRKSGKGKTIRITDVRQQQHALPAGATASRDTPDRWTRIASISSQLAMLIPSRTAAHFQSVFHSPNYSSTAEALRSTLNLIASNAEVPSELTNILFNMFDILSSSSTYATLGPESRNQLMADAQLALRATEGQCDEALDLVWLLYDLDQDEYLEMGVYHSPVAKSPTAWSPLPSPTIGTKLPSGPPPVPPPPKARSSKPKPPPLINEWQSIPEKRPPGSGVHPLAEYIPAYNNRNGQSAKVRGSGNGFGKGGKGDVGELSGNRDGRRQRSELRARSDEAYREASRYWQRGNCKSRGGEVALFFAERAREYQEQARKQALDDARQMVSSKRTRSSDRTTVDLHGTTVAEAITIIKDILREDGATSAQPLRIITGRGTHSANKIGVLGPAVKSALADDGWSVRSYDGGLVVTGRTAGRG